ncbi:hypothetical protein C6N75_12065 [Streptomyces solincola]|uniref:PPM-type phosphatase domain-containing protein n=1 Tax=Streptomyces solincola TaxID=2100817 RepID=A0A2S9PX23_9ACTN|nr:PP2C family protein-serine/threonine phosphatase [Streptomyces solincola]PRH78959.1 hypothetical protein C6N75_12065 [Streptomyces solincola]
MPPAPPALSWSATCTTSSAPAARAGAGHGDVSGKGVEAAKVTALARYTIRTEATQHARPATVLHHLHQAMVDQQISDRFLTAALTVFRTHADGDITGHYANAGHPPALLRRRRHGRGTARSSAPSCRPRQNATARHRSASGQAMR